MYRLRSKWTLWIAVLVAGLLFLYGLLLFGDQVPGEGASGNGISKWVRSLQEELQQSQPASEDLGWELVLVNERYTVPDSFPGELVTLKNGKKVDARIYPDLQDMFDAARKDGLGLTVRSGYRTKESQQQVFDDKVAEFRQEGRSGHKAKQLAKEWVALPGHSEHELGLAVDINADEQVCSKEDLYLWLSQNAIDYGFVCRYPSEKASITHVEHEPWHYRYVGKEHATAMKEKGLCLEEYVETLSAKT